MPPRARFRDDQRVLFRFLVAVAILTAGASLRMSLRQRALRSQQAVVDATETADDLRSQRTRLQLEVARLSSAKRLLQAADEALPAVR